jgi:ketosteroid isomerase-like protein
MSKQLKDFRHFMRTERHAAANAYVSGDPTPVSELSVTRDPATFYGPGGGVVTGAKNVIRNNNRSAQGFAPGSRSKFKVIQLAADGDLAFWTGIQSAKVQLRGKAGKVTMNLRVTEVFRQMKSGWKLVHRHADMLTKATKPAGSGRK